MGSLGKKFGSAIAVTAGILLVLTGLVGPAQAATSRVITLNANPTTAVGGSQIAFFGTVTHSGRGKGVKLQRKVGTTWAPVISTVTTTGGAYAVNATLPVAVGPYTFRTAAVPGGGLAAAYSTPVVVTSTAPPAGSPVITTTSLPNGIKNVAYSADLTKTGDPGTWTINSGALPTGVTLEGGSGHLGGTPTVAGTFNFTVKFTETAGGLSATKALSIVVPAGPTITTTSLPDATRNAAYSTTLTKTGGPGTWDVQGLPADLTFNASTGEISGTAKTIGDYGVYVTYTETTGGAFAYKAFALHVGGTALAITTTSLPDATRGAAYATTLTKTGGAGTWNVLGLPANLTFDPATGAITGIPGTSGDFGVYVTFTETAGGAFAYKAFALHVGGTPLAITTASLPDAIKGAPYTVTLTENGGPGTWASCPDTQAPHDPLPLPPGLSINPSTGVLSGTPTQAGDHAVFICFTETASNTLVYKGFALHVGAPSITTSSLPDGTTGTAYSQQLTKTGGAGTWSYTGGDLPPGLTLSASGLLSGTPTQAGDYPFQAVFTETASGTVVSKQLFMHVSAAGAPVINTTALPDGTVGVPYSFTLTGTPAGGTWDTTYNTLPPGLTLNAATGQITGTPIVKDDELIIFQYTQGGKSNTKLLSIHIAAAPAG